jgi:predicted nucleotidyltransferase
VHSQEFYLSAFERKDTVGYTPDAVFDLSGWDVRKFIQHLVKSNAVMLEWLQSGVIYRKDDAVAQKLWQLGQAFFNPVSASWHYLSMARNKLAEVTAKDSAKIKTYFYIMRPLACVRFIREHGKVPFMEYPRNLEVIQVPEDILEKIDALMARKNQAQESELVPLDTKLLDYFSREMAEAVGWLSTFQFEKNRDYEAANQCFREIILMVNAND